MALFSRNGGMEQCRSQVHRSDVGTHALLEKYITSLTIPAAYCDVQGREAIWRRLHTRTELREQPHGAVICMSRGKLQWRCFAVAMVVDVDAAFYEQLDDVIVVLGSSITQWCPAGTAPRDGVKFNPIGVYGGAIGTIL